MTNIEIIKAACAKANPEIMEISFGCDLKRNDQYGSIYKCVNEHGFANNNKKVWLNSVPFGAMEVERERIGKGLDFEILGRPITLQDVLLALENVEKYILVDVIGNMYTHDANDGSLIDEGIWNLRASLEDQSEETLQFLADLLH